MRNSWSRFVVAAGLLASGACRVYNPDLLHADGSRADGSDVTTADADVATDGVDATDHGPDVPIVTDGSDVPTDAPASCDAILAAGGACIEPYSGQTYSADDPRLIAPSSLAVSSDVNPLVAVGDLGTGRVVGFGLDGSMPMRLVGTGVISVPTGDGPGNTTTLASPSAMLFLPTGDLVIADSVAHTLYVYRRGSRQLERFGTLAFQEGPFALGTYDANSILVAADNRVYTINIALGTPGTPTPFAGCGLGCRGFNTTPMTGDATLFDSPTGVDSDATYIYIADSRNCRIRRVQRTSTTNTVTVFAGGACDPNADILGGIGAPIAATSAHLGPVGDVKVGADGTVYFTDPSAHCAILAVSTIGATANQVRVIAGSSMGCGATGVGGVALGRLGGLGISDDRNTLFFVDAQGQRIGRIQLNAPGGPSAPTFTITPGVTPSATDTIAQLRVGAVSGLAVSGTEADPTVYWAGAFEQRVYRAMATSVGIFAGNGRSRLIPPIPAANLEPALFTGLGYAEGHLVLPLQNHHAVANLSGTAVFRVAGTYDQAGEPTLTGAASSDTIHSPAWPIVHGNNLYFGSQGPTPRVYRVDGVVATNPIVPVAGAGTADAGVPTVDASIPSNTAAIGRPAGLAFDASDDLFIADPVSHVVWREHAGSIEIVAGLYRQLTPLDDSDNDARGVAIPDPQALAFDGAHTLYIADRSTHRIRALDLTTNRLRTVAGAGGNPADYAAAATSSIGEVSALAMVGNRLYFGEWDTGRVRVLRVAP